jgi:hypothetical protein
VLETVTHENLSSCVFYFSCLVGLVYSNLKLKGNMYLTYYNYLIINYKLVSHSAKILPITQSAYNVSSLTNQGSSHMCY